MTPDNFNPPAQQAPPGVYICQSCGQPLQGILTQEAKDVANKMRDVGMVMLCEKCKQVVIDQMIETLKVWGYTVTKTPKVKLT